METNLVSPQITVKEVLTAKPEAVEVFLRNKTACVGCYFDRFCALEAVAQTYGLRLESFLGELQGNSPSIFLHQEQE